MTGEIKTDVGGLNNLHTQVKPNIQQLDNTALQIKQVEAGISSAVMIRANVEEDLASLEATAYSSRDGFANTCAGIKRCIDDFFNADTALAKTMRGVGYLASGVVAGPVGMAAYDITGQLVRGNVDALNTIFGMVDKSAGLFTDIKNTLGGWFNNAKETVAGVLDNKWVKVGLASASIIASVAAIAGSGILTVGSFGALTPGMVAVSVFGANNIIAQGSKIINILSGNGDDGVNLLKSGCEFVCSESAGLVATGLNQVGIVSEEYVSVAKEYGKNVGTIGFDVADVMVGNIEPADASKIVSVTGNIAENADKVGNITKVMNKITDVSSKAADLVDPINKFNDALDWVDRGNDFYQYSISKQNFNNANWNIITTPVRNFIN